MQKSFFHKLYDYQLSTPLSLRILSILSADFLHLEDEIRMLSESSAEMIHLDIMDGSLVPNISFGFSVIDPIRKVTDKLLDAHLMIINPDKYFERFAASGMDMLSFHYEAAVLAGKDPSDWLKRIRGLGMKAGLAINPDVPVADIAGYAEYADFILVMSVFAGYSGQKFIESTYERITELKRFIDSKGYSCEIEVDGGVSPSNCAALAASGADILVAASSVFKSDNPKGVIDVLHC